MWPACARPRARPFSRTASPQTSDIMVTHLEKNGAIVYAMSNTPEFGAGANTFNEVFGRTLNPWNTSRSAAGSSGGAAVALATGTAWLAHGSDLGGSLRNPASFCGVVGMRPSPGRVAATSRQQDRLHPRRRRPHGPQCRRRGTSLRCHGGRRAGRSDLACPRTARPTWKPRAPAGSQSASPSAAISASRPSIRKWPTSS